MAFTLPALPYSYGALEPHIDAQTMEIHYTKHHQAYLNNLNNAIKGTDADNLGIEEIIKNISKYPMPVRNNGGGLWNHTFFWESMAPNSGGEPSGVLGVAIDAAFGSFTKFKEDFSNAGITRFGSGWAWLVVQDGALKIGSTPNQDNPLMDISELKGSPILGLDVWEHAYYLKYQNRRPDYIGAWWNTINWEQVSRRFHDAK